ncbi:transcriptional regulator [Achromobacter denitrificans]|uniref:AraC family transcriptional regulator n=1 Tax=Achromobacter denitrificans TaxID=32002 RepID=UPI00166D6EE1|nr:AraC family transcriptional regulator [Achromobacter denitrificans]GFN28363.1 transcriptional regulator [Achromobacter denitrificans]
MTQEDWIQVRRDEATGIEVVHAHFRGHAYDPHDHDEMLVGITLQGVQQFHCARRTHNSTPGNAMLIEPGAVHDGQAGNEQGFTYSMLYLPLAWVGNAMERRERRPGRGAFSLFRASLSKTPTLVNAIATALRSFEPGCPQLARDEALDCLIAQLAADEEVPPGSAPRPAPSSLRRAQAFIDAHMAADISMDQVARNSGMDRHALARQFRRELGMAPHAYLVNARLKRARVLLAQGILPAEVAAQVGFADQSHLGRWFKRAYRITPARYLQCAQTF